MKLSKQIIKDAGIFPKLKIFEKLPGGGTKPTGPHRVKMISDKAVKVKDQKTGEIVQGIRYTVEENGEMKNYTTKLLSEVGGVSYLVEKLAYIEEGEYVILEGTKGYNKNNYIEVKKDDGTIIETKDSQEENIDEADDED